MLTMPPEMGVTGKAIKLMNFPKFFHQFRRTNTITKLPARAMIGLPKEKQTKLLSIRSDSEACFDAGGYQILNAHILHR